MVLDSLDDLSLIKYTRKEIDECIDMYYRYCIVALISNNVSSSPDVEAKYFMKYGWSTHEARSKLSCLVDNIHWNRNGSGCIEDLITRVKFQNMIRIIMNVKKTTQLIQTMGLKRTNINQLIFDYIKQELIFAAIIQI